ncbi:malonate decarboxylase holo-[acyl-carrier-protein] synthase [Achromobacter sp. GG226]|uniref:malonate decarboxylase holo-[acyl-carrier-protein] synthase n=1 Tax=Verticiella alkaliphila TaxID=2779529 RepID=UPI001C0CD6E8|nr:malonate decarboxylase holo-[acyl-carrier-protein] synthase [Verticiella sp. GG226]MBU4609599.1 malonate decarboxylase holo-[acyl-carrier-protein] synthase [Verticiella sp. GG226]
MPALRRHQLARLTPQSWQALLTRAWDNEARACLTHWATHGLPLVVTVQRAIQPGEVALGLPAPWCWGRRRIALQVAKAAIESLDTCPPLHALAHTFPDRAPSWQPLIAALDSLHAQAHVYGSHAWQHLTGLDYVHAESDLDLWVGVAGEDHADAVAAALGSASPPGLRCDGELVFPAGAAVNAREWQTWREGRARSLLVRELNGASLCTAATFAATPTTPQESA